MDKSVAEHTASFTVQRFTAEKVKILIGTKVMSSPQRSSFRAESAPIPRSSSESSLTHTWLLLFRNIKLSLAVMVSPYMEPAF